jgi:GPI ethanolamine phosphate transferase 3 subunit O
MFGDYFDETHPYPSFNVRDLDTLDDQVRTDMLRTKKQGNFTLLIGHVIRVDHAGHTYSSSHSEIERKLRDTEKLIKDIIEEMDGDKVIMVFWDHGMTDDGYHGGTSQTDLRSVLFAYSKKGFLMKTNLPKS